MDLFEYQARDLFEKHGVPVLPGIVATTPAEARAAAERLLGASGGVVVVKAQVKAGGRGKAGGVKLARSADEAEEVAGQILGMDIKGHTVRRVMVAAGARIASEYYVSLLLDRANRRYLAYGIQAMREGRPDIAQLFFEAAGAETIHALNHLQVMNAVASTRENLERAARGEMEEIEVVLPRMIREAEEEGRHDAAASFRLALDRERYHRDMFRAALAGHTLAECERLAAVALDTDDAAEARAAVLEESSGS